MVPTSKKWLIVVLLSVLGLGYYLSINAYLGFPREGEMMTISDVQDIVDNGIWYWKYFFTLEGEKFDPPEDTGTMHRPFGAPIINSVIYKVFGTTGIWLFQVICWIISLNLIFFSLFNFTKSYLFSSIGFLIIGSSLSILLTTRLGYTESITVLGMSFILLWLSRNIFRYKKLEFYLWLSFFFSILTIIKPLFQYPFFALLAVCSIKLIKQSKGNWRQLKWYYLFLTVFYLMFYLNKNVLWIKVFPFYVMAGFLIVQLLWKRFKQHNIGIRSLRLMMVVCLPVVIQTAIIWHQYRVLTISSAGYHTYKNSFACDVYSKVNNFSHKAVDDVVFAGWTKNQIISYPLEHPKEAIIVYFDNMYKNFVSSNHVLFENETTNARKLDRISEAITRSFFWVYIIYFALLLPVFLYSTRKAWYSTKALIVILSCLLFYMIFATGLVYQELDRYTIPPVTVLSFLLPLTIFELKRKW